MKFPVFKAIATTFAFAAQYWLDLLRIIWAPVALFAVASVIYSSAFQRYLLQVASSPPYQQQGLPPAFFDLLPYMAASLLISTLFGVMTTAGIHKLVLRGEKPALPFYLNLGMDEWRLFLTGLVFVCIFLLVQVTMIVLVGLVSAVSAISPMVGSAAGFILVIVTMFFLIRLLLRLSLVTAACVDTRRIGVKPSFTATRGNELPLLGYWLLWIVMGFALQIAATAILVPEAFGAYQAMLNPGSVESQQLMQEAMAASARNFDLTTPLGVARIAVSWLFAAIQIVFGLLAASIAWRMVNEGKQTAKLSVPEGSASSVMGF